MIHMKYRSLSCALFGLASLCFFSCTEEDYDIQVPEYTKFENPNWKPSAGPVPAEAPTNWTVEFTGGMETPQWEVVKPAPMSAPAWKAPDMYVYPASMTAVVRMSDYIHPDITEDDLFGAFIGGECRGLGSAVQNADGETLFLIQVKAAQSETRKVEFRFFSAKKQELFVTGEVVGFEADETLGSVDAPCSLTWNSLGELPYYMDLDVRVNLSAFDQGSVAEGDVVAAFVGEECRGLGQAVQTDEGYAFQFRTWARNASEKLSLRYYTSTLKDIYLYSEPVDFSHTALTEVEMALNEHGYMDLYARLPEVVRPYLTERDNLAAFVADQPCSIIQQHEGDSYQLKMKGSEGDQVSFRYYCDSLKYVFTSPACLSYSDSQSWGSEAQYNVLPLETAQQLVTMNGVFFVEAYKAINTELAEGDMLAAFVGDECRGLAFGELYNEQLIFDMDIRGTLGVDEQFTLQYYHIANRYKFTCHQIFNFEPAGKIGERNLPMGITLHVVE